jgi:hypothetical protein
LGSSKIGVRCTVSKLAQHEITIGQRRRNYKAKLRRVFQQAKITTDDLYNNEECVSKKSASLRTKK